MTMSELNSLAIEADDAAQSLYCILESFDLPGHQEQPALFVAGELCGKVGKLLSLIEALHEQELKGRQLKAA